MTFNWNKQLHPIIGLSPMADMTDSAFSKIVRSVVSKYSDKSRLIIFREMVSSEAIMRDSKKTLEMTKIDSYERPLIQQIFGSDPSTMAKAASIIVEKYSPEGIDINMGCPVHKMISNFNGAALMKDPELASKIVRAVKACLKIPVSVKMRAGWSKHNECIEFAKVIEDAGADLITVHGRTQKQGYSGIANRDVVAKVKSSISIPVLYNGDIFSCDDYFNALEQTKCDGALIARGALGNPWIFAQIEQCLTRQEPMTITLKDRISVVLEHLDAHILLHGEKSLPTFRKHLSWYFKSVPKFKLYKIELMKARQKSEIIEILNDFLAKQN
jgi:tRNA-dihydrouridine synthase B